MHRYLIMSVGIVTLTFATAALAGDPNNWTGAYVGAHAGYGWSAWDGKQEYTDAASVPLVPFGPFDTSSHTINANGALAGGEIGYNYQIGRVVVGVEGDGSWADLRAAGRCSPTRKIPIVGQRSALQAGTLTSRMTGWRLHEPAPVGRLVRYCFTAQAALRSAA